MLEMTKEDVANHALAACGELTDDGKIDDFDELTSNAATVRRFWNVTMQAFLETAWWSFATAYEVLTQHSGTLPPHWGYEYKRPVDMVMPRKILVGTPEENPPWEEAIDKGVPVIYTNRQAACLEYTAQVLDFNVWSGNALEAFILKLAVAMSPALSGSTGKITIIRAQYVDALETAQVASHNRQVRHSAENESTEFSDFRTGTGDSVRHGSVYVRKA